MQKFSESEMRVSMTKREIDANNWFYSKAWGWGRPPSISAAEGGQSLNNMLAGFF
jgi:hypothetical protein